MRVHIVIAFVVGITGRGNCQPQQSGTTSASDQTNSRPTCGSAAAVSHIPSFTSFIRDDASPLNNNGGLASLHNSKTYWGISTFKCAASLVSDQYLITAAHCMAESHGLIGIVLGRENLTQEALPRNTYEIAEKFVHPDYNPSKREQYSDIAIVRTNRKVILGYKIWPYCLPEKNQVFPDYQTVQILGWGYIDRLKEVSPVVKTAFVKIVENKRCESLWLQWAPGIYEDDLKQFSYPRGLTNSLLCAGRDGVGSCQGDSGGPMSIQSPDGLNRVIGVVSKGIDCPKEIKTPGFYVNIAVFIDWIIETTGLPKPVSIIPESTNTPHSTGEEPFWCSLVASSQQCSDPEIDRNCTKLCSVRSGPVSPAALTAPAVKLPSEATGLQVCRFNLQCEKNEKCQSGFCVNLCGLLQCGQGAKCQVSQRKGQCVCPAGTEGNPLKQCDIIPECNDDSHCGDGELCRIGSCVNNCAAIQCGVGAKCQMNGNNTQCICPANTDGNPTIRCQPIQVCRINLQCKNNEKCQSGFCINLCGLLQCGQGAKCQVSQRQGQCVCPTGTEGNPRKQCEPIPGCIGNSQCSNNEICDRGRCVVDPCSRVQCPANTRCQVVQGQTQCHPIPGLHHDFCQQFDTDSCKVAAVREHCPEKCSGCIGNSQCSNNEICDRGRCVVDPCSRVKCPANTRCQVVQGQTQCQPIPDCSGSCIPINECPNLLNTLAKAQVGNADAVEKLRNSVCSNTNGYLSVCCP